MESDMIITCTDSMVSRMQVAYAARMLGLPMLDAGVMGPEHVGGRVAYYAPYPEAACYSCGLSIGARGAVLEHLSSPSLSCAALPFTEAMGSSPEGAASVTATAKRVVQQVAQGFHAVNSHAWRMRDGETDRVDLPVSSECPWHHQAELIVLNDDRPIREALSEDDLLLLPWPIALTVTCDRCGAQHGTPMLLAGLRQGTSCSQCGEKSLQPGRVVERICREDDVAELTPSQLGLPPRNVFPARKRIQMQRTF